MKKLFQIHQTAGIALSILVLGAACETESTPDNGGVGGAKAGEASGGSAAAGASSATGGNNPGAGAGNAGGADGGPDCAARLPAIAKAPRLLSELGLYEDIETHQVADDIRAFVPNYKLWSDGAEKSRWLYLPPCTQIDTSNVDHWQFPVGTRAFKEFRVDGKRIETRLVHRFGEGADDYLYAHYLWNDEESEAVLIDAETPDEARISPKGTDYEVPGIQTCGGCHGGPTDAPLGGTPSRFLGASLVQLRDEGEGLRLSDLEAEGRLSDLRIGWGRTPGTLTEKAAIGYLHANCGFCHNPTSEGVQFPMEPFSLYINYADYKLELIDVMETAVDHAPLGFEGSCEYRIAPGNPDNSCVVERMSSRASGVQMPPIDSIHVDTEGLALIRSWIDSL